MSSPSRLSWNGGCPVTAFAGRRAGRLLSRHCGNPHRRRPMEAGDNLIPALGNGESSLQLP